MNKIELVKVAYDLDNPDGIRLWSEDFQRTDVMGNPPMDWDSWQAMNGLMRSAFPDPGLVILTPALYTVFRLASLFSRYRKRFSKLWCKRA